MKKNPKITRRNFMAAAGGTIVSIGLPGVFVKVMDLENRALAAQLRADGRSRIPPGQHAVKALPNMGGVKGPGKVPDWRLTIDGEARGDGGRHPGLVAPPFHLLERIFSLLIEKIRIPMLFFFFKSII